MLIKKLFRTAWNYRAQFISMIVMVAIGIGIFVGFNVEWYSLYRDTHDYMSDTGYADYRIIDEDGFSEEDLKIVENIDGVKSATRYLSVNVTYENGGGKSKTLGLTMVDNYGEDSFNFYLCSGKEYDEDETGIWLNDKFAKENHLEVGDTIQISYINRNYELEIIGTIKSSEYLICVSGDDQLMPDYGNYGYFIITPKQFESMMGFTMYSQINIISEVEKEDMLASIDEAFGKTMMTITKEETTSYAEAHGEMNEGRIMSRVLPVLFLAIAVLTMITTMNRLTANEKIQIGTFKALGFKDCRIIWHYTSYGLFIGVIGTILGVILGYGIGAYIINEDGMMATYIDMPDWGLTAPWYVLPVLLIVLIILTFLCYLSVKKMLVGTAADALRPYVPKKMKTMFFEKTSFWQKRSFKTKWNVRDIFRHKSRSFMTLFGVMGCTVLIIASLGMMNTLDAFTKMMYSDICNYDTKIKLVQGSQSLANRYEGDLLSEISVKIDEEAIILEVYDIEHDKIRFVNEDNRTFHLKDDGVYVCLRLSDKYKIGDTLTFSPYGSDESYEVTVAGYMRSMVTKNIAMTENYAKSIGMDYSFTALFTDAEPEEIEVTDAIGGIQSKKDIVESLDTLTGIMNQMVALLVAAAMLLAMIVLYNLGVMSYTERYRELATLKVVGFTDAHLSGLLISQNVWLTIVGMIVGLPLGYMVLDYLLVLLAENYEMSTTIYPWSYLLTVLLTFGVSMIVSWFVARKNKKIDMVEALK